MTLSLHKRQNFLLSVETFQMEHMETALTPTQTPTHYPPYPLAPLPTLPAATSTHNDSIAPLLTPPYGSISTFVYTYFKSNCATNSVLFDILAVLPNFVAYSFSRMMLQRFIQFYLGRLIRSMLPVR